MVFYNKILLEEYMILIAIAIFSLCIVETFNLWAVNKFNEKRHQEMMEFQIKCKNEYDEREFLKCQLKDRINEIERLKSEIKS
jgi:hypothetical protein